MTTIIFGILEEGLVYAIMALGVYITYKILDFPDLSVDGTFPLGAAVTAAGIANGLPFIGTISPVAALFISFAVGALAGCITGLIHVKLKVRDLLSGCTAFNGFLDPQVIMPGSYHNVKTNSAIWCDLPGFLHFPSDSTQISFYKIGLKIRFPESDLCCGDKSHAATGCYSSCQLMKADTYTHTALDHRSFKDQISYC